MDCKLGHVIRAVVAAKQHSVDASDVRRCVVIVTVWRRVYSEPRVAIELDVPSLGAKLALTNDPREQRSVKSPSQAFLQDAFLPHGESMEIEPDPSPLRSHLKPVGEYGHFGHSREANDLRWSESYMVFRHMLARHRFALALDCASTQHRPKPCPWTVRTTFLNQYRLSAKLMRQLSRPNDKRAHQRVKAPTKARSAFITLACQRTGPMPPVMDRAGRQPAAWSESA